MNNLFRDILFALRVYKNQPGFTLIVILTLGISVGFNVCIFSLIDTLILRPLPYPGSDRIVQLARNFKDGPQTTFSFTQFQFWQHNTSTLERVAAYDVAGSGLNLVHNHEIESVRTIR